MHIPTPTSPTPQATSPKATRRMVPWKLALGISIGWKVLVLTLGAAVPRWVIGDGLDLIPVASHAYAKQAQVTAMTLWNHPLERLGIVRAMRVTRVDSTVPRNVPRNVPSYDAAPSAQPGSTPVFAPRSPHIAQGDRCRTRSATVVAYTYFAIPYSQVRTVCDSGVVEYRLFRRRS